MANDGGQMKNDCRARQPTEDETLGQYDMHLTEEERLSQHVRQLAEECARNQNARQLTEEEIRDQHARQLSEDKTRDQYARLPTVETQGHRARQLTQPENDALLRDTKAISDYKRNKLEKEARKNWDLFYKRNTTRFFKDRHWTKREFEELCGIQNKRDKTIVLEVGCGVGNFVFPLIEEDTEKQFFFYACDFSARAVQFVKDNKLFDASHLQVFQCDVTNDSLDAVIQENSVDIATLIFVLSAISPEKMMSVIQNLHKVLKPGGVVLFRDYGLYDHAMLRFAPGHKISQHFYVRQDGTRAYYFTEEEVSDLFCRCGYELISNKYVNRKTVNKKEGLSAERIFVQSKFRKNASCQESVRDSKSSQKSEAGVPD